MAISHFHTHVIGANRPIGSCLTKLLADQQFIFKGFSLDSRERQTLQSSSRPFYVLTPAIHNEGDLRGCVDWVHAAKDQDAAILLVSSVLQISQNLPVLSKDLEVCFELMQQVEELISANPQHIILRVGEAFSLMEDDFANQILNGLRTTPILKLDDETSFSPTPADDIAEVLLAILKQCNCTDTLWGTYSFNGVEKTHAYGFAEALLAEISQFEDFSQVKLTSEANTLKPSPPLPLITDDKLFHAFGIKPKAWRSGLHRLVKQYYAERTPQ